MNILKFSISFFLKYKEICLSFLLCFLLIIIKFINFNNIIFYLYPIIIHLLQNNQFCQAVIFSSFSAYILYLIQIAYRSYILPLFSGMVSSVTIHNTDPNFHAVIDYIAENGYLENVAALIRAPFDKPDKFVKLFG